MSALDAKGLEAQSMAVSHELAGFFQTDVAARVVEQSARSVLVLPLDSSSPAAA